MTITGLTTGTFRDEDPALELSTTYYYRVSTTATSGDSVRSRPSNVANARTGPVEVPGAPTGLTLEVKGPSRIDLTWTAPVSTGGADIDGYRIEYSDDDDDSPAADTWTRLVANTHERRRRVRRTTGLRPNSKRENSGTTGFRRSTPPARARLLSPCAVRKRPRPRRKSPGLRRA